MDDLDVQLLLDEQDSISLDVSLSRAYRHIANADTKCTDLL